MPHINGIEFDEEGRLILAGAGTGSAIVPGGVLTTDAGAVVLSNSTPDVMHQGVGLMNDGSLAILETSSVVVNAFDSGFSTAFD
jgi:hypothetical protein